MKEYVLEGLQPRSVFRFFEELSRIPRGSGDNQAASDWCVRFAQERGLRWRQDEALNVIIWKDASPGYEDHPAVILQGHLDMVCVQDKGVDHDFTKDSLGLYVDGDFVKARGTTLGGDNGIAVAMALAVLDDDAIAHPPIEAVFTTDEEIGLLGAVALDCSDLQGRMLLNLDSEEEGILTVSCAGGARCDITRTYPTAACSGTVCTLTVSGLQGGHSGIEINMGRANANKVLAECLAKMPASLRLVSVFGGLQDNAIPKEASASFLLDGADLSGTGTDDLQKEFAARFAAAEPGLSIALEIGGEGSREALSSDDSAAFIRLLNDYPNGVQAMSNDIDGLVQTSLNLGVLRLEKGSCQLSSAIRSSVSAEKTALSQRLAALAAAYGADFGQRGDYPAWEYRKDSPLRETMVQVYREQYGKEPVIEAIHAGLECGIFSDKLPGLDAVSIGPDLAEVHSTRERLSISSTERFWQYLLGILARL